MGTMKLIRRENYLDKLLSLRGVTDIKVITGVRRSGKSMLLTAFINEITVESPDTNIIHVNLLHRDNKHLLKADALYDYVEGKRQEGKENILCIDEVQLCRDFEKAVSWFYESGNYSIYITGSNAFLLSSDLATLFTGRTFEIEIFPFSFAEYMKYYELSNPFEALDSYITDGGFAGSYLYNESDSRYQYIKNIFTTLIVRDIKAKHALRNPGLLNQLTDFFMDNFGNITSLRNITDTLSAMKEPTNHKTVSSYVGYLCNAFLFYRIHRYDIAGKKYLASQDKYYLCDHSFRYAILGTKSKDTGRILENMVAIELLRRGYEVYVGCLYKKEIDFVAVKKDEKVYIQVADDISNKDTLKRECALLLKIHDQYPKYLLARTRDMPYDIEGIRVYDVGWWLCHTNERSGASIPYTHS